MTTMQIGALNAEIQHNLGAIADDETLLKRVAKYLRRIAKQKEDPTLMTKEEFFRHVDESMEQARHGRTHRISSVEELDNFLNSL